MRVHLIAFLACLALPVTASSAECRLVRGRMSLWNGTPSVRIWVVGTKRILGVVQQDETFGDLPENVRKAWAANGNDAMWSSDLFGDFRVCPRTQDKPGRMQSVVVKEASRLRLQARP